MIQNLFNKQIACIFFTAFILMHAKNQCDVSHDFDLAVLPFYDEFFDEV